jgi:hypothetical protein
VPLTTLCDLAPHLPKDELNRAVEPAQILKLATLGEIETLCSRATGEAAHGAELCTPTRSQRTAALYTAHPRRSLNVAAARTSPAAACAGRTPPRAPRRDAWPQGAAAAPRRRDARPQGAAAAPRRRDARPQGAAAAPRRRDGGP